MRLLLAATALFAIAACSQQAENPRSVQFKAIAKANKAIGEALKADAPDLAKVATEAKTLDDLARALPGWFPGTSGPEAGIETEAKAEIWQKRSEFDAKAQKFIAATGALRTAAEAGDLTATKAAAEAVGPTCKGCHTDFRAKK